MILRALSLSLIALPALADTRPGPVGQMVLAHDLFALGQSTGDVSTLATAARLAGAVDLTPRPREAKTEGKATKDQPDAHPAPLAASEMGLAATAAAGTDELYLSLIDDGARGNALVRAGNAALTQSTLAAGQSHVWALPFDGGTTAELGIIGDGDGNLDITVTDEGGTMILRDARSTDRAHVVFIPEATGYYTVTVQNLGPGTNTYYLLTN